MQRRFLFHLAMRLGKTVKQLLHEMDSDEITEWQAFFYLLNEPEETPNMMDELKAAFGKLPGKG